MQQEERFHAFLSYARNDDHDGDISKFHKALEAELGSVWLRDCKIFMDARDITVGSRWEQVLSNSLGEVKFLVAMVSPSFLESSECKREVETYRDFASRHGAALIVPVLTHPCFRFSGTDFYEDLRSLQFADYTNVRILEASSSAFRSFVVKVAVAIEEKLRTPEEPKKTMEELREDLAKSEAARTLLDLEVEAIKGTREQQSESLQTIDRLSTQLSQSLDIISRLRTQLHKARAENTRLKDQIASSISVRPEHVTDLKHREASLQLDQLRRAGATNQFNDADQLLKEGKFRSVSAIQNLATPYRKIALCAVAVELMIAAVLFFVTSQIDLMQCVIVGSAFPLLLISLVRGWHTRHKALMLLSELLASAIIPAIKLSSMPLSALQTPTWVPSYTLFCILQAVNFLFLQQKAS